MSTKIYNGMIIRDSNIEEVKTKIESLKEKYLNKVKVQYTNVLTNFYYKILDGLEGNSENTVLKELSLLIDKEKEELKKGYRSVYFDFEVSISLKELNGNVYGSLFFENNALEEELHKDLNIEEYGYWDNVDKPDKLSETAWEVRRKTWDRLLDKHYSFSKAGFENVLIVDNEELFKIELSFEDIKDYDIEARKEKYVRYNTPSLVYHKKNTKKEFLLSAYNEIVMEIRDGGYKEESKNMLYLFENNIIIPTKENYKELKGMDSELWKK